MNEYKIFGLNDKPGEPGKVIVNPNKGVRETSQYNSFKSSGYDADDVLEFLKNNYITDVKILDDGSYCGIHRLAYTWSVCVDITPTSMFAYRWCFADREEALKFLSELTEFDQYPDLNVYKSLKGHRYMSEPRIIQFDELGFKKW